MMSTELVIFEYQGEEVLFDPTAQMWSLNAMHRAAGGERSKEPSRWLNQAQTQELLAALTEEETTRLNGSISVLVETREGRNGGTWAVPVLSLAYAHYLKPQFYIACNRWMLRQLDDQGSDSARLAVIADDIAQLKLRVAALETQKAHQRPTQRLEAPDEPHMSPERQDIINALRKRGRPMRTVDIFQAVGSKNYNNTSQLVRRMLVQGQIVRSRYYQRYELPEQEQG
jgi:hypothetical protein